MPVACSPASSINFPTGIPPILPFATIASSQVEPVEIHSFTSVGFSLFRSKTAPLSFELRDFLNSATSTLPTFTSCFSLILAAICILLNISFGSKRKPPKRFYPLWWLLSSTRYHQRSSSRMAASTALSTPPPFSTPTLVSSGSARCLSNAAWTSFVLILVKIAERSGILSNKSLHS